MTTADPHLSSQIILPRPETEREREIFESIADRDKEVAERIEEVDTFRQHLAFNVKAWGAKADGTTDDSTSIQKAIDEAEGGGVVFFPEGIYLIETPLELKQGVWLRGIGTGIRTNSTVPMSILRAGANMSSIVHNDSSSADQEYGIINLAFDGNKASYTVTNILDLVGRRIFLERLMIENGSGTGLYLRPHVGIQKSWINWISRCQIRNCTTYGLNSEASDQWFIGNYLGSNGENRVISHANTWMGTMIDNSTVGLRVISDEKDDMAELFYGNKIEQNTTGMIFEANDGLTQWDWNGQIVGSKFRTNTTDVDVYDGLNFTMNGAFFKGGTTGLKFDAGCAHGLLSDLHFEKDTYTTHFSGLPSTMCVRDCRSTNSAGSSALYSDRQGQATITTGNTSVTVTHNLFATPTGVIVTPRSNPGAFFWTTAYTATTFDIVVASAVGANVVFEFWATMSP